MMKVLWTKARDNIEFFCKVDSRVFRRIILPPPNSTDKERNNKRVYELWRSFSSFFLFVKCCVLFGCCCWLFWCQVEGPQSNQILEYINAFFYSSCCLFHAQTPIIKKNCFYFHCVYLKFLPLFSAFKKSTSWQCHRIKHLTVRLKFSYIFLFSV